MRPHIAGLGFMLVLTMLLVCPPSFADGAAGQRRAGYPGQYPYRYAGAESHLRFAVTPKEASIYIDGYFAGLVDDYDGVFQRLHVEPGAHDVVIYLKGHRSIREKLYLSPNATRKISGTLDPLPAGEPDEPTPVPTTPPGAPSGGTPPRPGGPSV